MKYYLSSEAVLKWLETPCVYHVRNDELYELDQDSFDFLKNCSKYGCHSQNGEFTDYCLKEELLTKKKVAVKRPTLIKSPDPSLRYLELQITNKCNLTCKHCYINPPPPPFNSPLTKEARLSSVGQGHREVKTGFSEKNIDELSINQIKIVLKEFEQMQGLRVLITGGEPLLHSHFEEINKMLPKFLLRKVLFTNGIFLDEKKIEKLNVDEIQISIDGLEGAHDSLRGKGTYRLAMKAVQRSLDHGFHVSIATMVYPGNLRDFDEMEKLFKGMGIKEWTVDVPCITGRLEENLEFQIRAEAGGQYLKYGYGGGLHTTNPGFACGLHLMSILADGKVTKCTFYSDNAVGRVEEGLKTCWERIKPIRLDELQCDCEYIDSCRGGCRYRAGLFGNPLGKDPYRCALYGV
jgi:radical SAM protein with 4Fe4S-binding SPASM domain